MDTQQQVNEALQRDWGIQLPATYTEAEILQALALRIAALVEKSPEAFFQLMYRLDIPESKLNATVQDADAAMHVARLIYNRQLQKIESRQKYRRDDTDHDADTDLRW